jgi:hypothetical protein
VPPGNLAGLFDADAAGRDNDMIQKIAAERELPFVNLRNDLRGYNLTVDGIHLDAAGYLHGWTPSYHPSDRRLDARRRWHGSPLGVPQICPMRPARVALNMGISPNVGVF